MRAGTALRVVHEPDAGVDLAAAEDTAHVGYLPDERILGLPKLARVAEHTCMTTRGVQAAGSSTVTSTLLGTLRADAASRQEFFALSGVRT
jgi:GTP cyclohydrolase IA